MMNEATKIVPAAIAPVGKGTRFNAPHVDASCVFVVQRTQGRGAWVAKVVPEDEDYAGNTRIFTTKEIEASLRYAAYNAARKAACDAWFNALELGSFVHYRNVGTEFVRCVVVMKDDRKELLPFAFVGKTDGRDWPTWSSTRTYFVGKFIAKESWRPDYKCCFEAGEDLESASFDPRAHNPLP